MGLAASCSLHPCGGCSTNPQDCTVPRWPEATGTEHMKCNKSKLRPECKAHTGGGRNKGVRAVSRGWFCWWHAGMVLATEAEMKEIVTPIHHSWPSEHFCRSVLLPRKWGTQLWSHAQQVCAAPTSPHLAQQHGALSMTSPIPGCPQALLQSLQPYSHNLRNSFREMPPWAAPPWHEHTSGHPPSKLCPPHTTFLQADLIDASTLRQPTLCPGLKRHIGVPAGSRCDPR